MQRDVQAQLGMQVFKQKLPEPRGGHQIRIALRENRRDGSGDFRVAAQLVETFLVLRAPTLDDIQPMQRAEVLRAAVRIHRSQTVARESANGKRASYDGCDWKRTPK